MHRMVHPCTSFHISTMSMGTLYIYLLLRLNFMLRVYHITKLDSLITRKDNLFKANLRVSLAILMTRRDSPYRATLQASKGHYTIRKDNITTLQVNSCSLFLDSNRGNLKDSQANQGTNPGWYTVLGGKSNPLNLCNRSILLVPMLHISQDHLMVLLQVKPVISNHLALFHYQANQPIRHNLVSRHQVNRPTRHNLVSLHQANWPIWHNLVLLNNRHNQHNLFIRVNLFIQGSLLSQVSLFS